jgi:hypothetical protein
MTIPAFCIFERKSTTRRATFPSLFSTAGGRELSPGCQGLLALEEAGLLHVLSVARTRDGRRPRSAAEIVSLDLTQDAVAGDGFKVLGSLKSLQSLKLRGDFVIDSSLKRLAGLKSLQALDLTGTNVTDEGLKELDGHFISL